MRRLAKLSFDISSHNPTRRAGMHLGFVALLALVLFAFSPFAHAQIVASDFEDGTAQGWGPQGSVTLTNSTDVAHSGTHSLLTSGRTANWNGPSISFTSKASPGQAWEFAVWARLAAGQAADKLTMTMKTTTSSDGYNTVASVSNVTDSDWVLLKGRYVIPDGTTGLLLYIEAQGATTSYYIDDFVAYPQQPSGCSNPADITGIQTDFESGTQGWSPRPYSNVTVATTNADKHSGSYSLLQTGRTQQYNTAGYDATGKMCNGSSYQISVWVKMAPDATTPVDLSVGAKATLSGTDSYLNLTSTKTVDNSAWVQFTGTFDLKQNYDTLWIYVQPISDTSSSYYIDDFSLTYIPPPQTIENIDPIGAKYADVFRVGAAVYEPDITAGDVHADLLARHFTSVTPENDMKWTATEATENTFDYTKAEAIVDFAANHNMAVRGHTLVWDQQTPDWVFKDGAGVDMSTEPYSDANRTLLLNRMKNHIQTLISHFGGNVTSWDVVNEAFDESQPDGFRHGKWYTITGGTSHGAIYIDLAFQYAKEAADAITSANPIKLYLNDYNTTIPSKLGFITAYLSAAKGRGIPIDGVGHQFHNKLDWPVNDDPTSINAVTQTINSVAALGLDNQITEMDISIYRNIPTTTTYQSYGGIVANLQNDLVIQGYRYRDYFSAFQQLTGKISSVTLWGEADDHTWLTTVSKADAPLPFDNNLIHKPAYTGIMDAASLPNALPSAGDVNINVLRNTPTEVTLPASDANGDPLTYSIVDNPTNGGVGTVTGNKVTYSPGTDYSGPDVFTFKANDGKGDSNVGHVNITVLGAPVAVDQSVTTDFNTAKAIILAATGDGTMTYTVVTQPAHGSLSGAAPNVTYTPTTGYWGADSFTFKANNGIDGTVGTVSITVLPAAPVALNQSITVDYNTPTVITLTSTGNGTMTYTIIGRPKGQGTLVATPAGQTTTWTYTNDNAIDPYMAKPPEDVDQDHFTFKVNNGHDSDIATVSITIRPAALKVAVAPGQATSQSVSAGGNATFNLQVMGYQGSTYPATFTCGGIPNYATCTVSPNQVTMNELTPVSFSVSITTSGSAILAAGSTSPFGPVQGMRWLPLCAVVLFGLSLLTIRKAKMQWRFVGACAVLLMFAAFTGCGGKSFSNTNKAAGVTPTGTYNVLVTAVATRNLSGEQKADWKITGEVPLTLTVR